MIRGTGHHHTPDFLPARVPPRHGGPLLPMRFTATTLTRMTAPNILNLRSSTVMLRSCRSGRDGRGPTIRFGTKPPR